MSTRSFSALETHLGYWLRHVSNHVSVAFARALQARQVSVAEWVTLRLIYERTTPTPGEIAELTGMTRGAISKVLDKLEAKAWIARSADPKDNRVQWLTLSAQGTVVLPELARIADTNDAQYFDCLDAEEQETLKQLLQKVARAHGWNDAPVD